MKLVEPNHLNSSVVESFVQALMAALKERDPETYRHCARVSLLSRKLAEAAGLSEEEQQIAAYASLFHDLGKMGIPDSILFKPGRLTPEEEAIMRTHPEKSVEILTPLQGLEEISKSFQGILHHHERVDGRGYPFGLSGDEIPLISRLILIPDTFDAMTSDRPYRKALPFEVAYKELKIFAGRQFDEQIVKIFLEAHPHWEVEKETAEDAA